MKNLTLPEQEVLRKFCQKWSITTLELFGSALTEDFNDKSDFDVMVTFAPESVPGPSFVELKEELELIFGRSVDVVTRKAIERSGNTPRKESILRSARVIYGQKAA